MYHKDAFGRLFFSMWHLTKKYRGGVEKREFIKHEILKLHLKEKKYEDD